MPIERPSSPRYAEIAADLRRRIIDRREWTPGEQIPSHKALCAEYGVSDSVMTAARKVLVSEGLLEAHPGAGMYVRRRTVRHRITRADRTDGKAWTALPLREQERPAGRPSDWGCRSQTVTVDRSLAQILRIEPGERAMETEYQVRSTGAIVRLTTCWEPYSVVGSSEIILPEDGLLAGRSVRERMAAIGIVVERAVEEVVARPASAAEGELLGGGAGAPVLEVTRVYEDTDGRPVHAERTVVRGDRGSLVYRF